MNKKQFQKFIDRDERCPHCLKDGDTLNTGRTEAWVAVDP
jgi:hypothetical protein